MRDVGVVIPAGGIGRRLGHRTPKQLLRIGATTIVARTVAHFARHPSVTEVVVVAPAEYLTRTRRALAPLRTARVRVVEGGAERQDSVRHGVQALAGGVRIMVVHDAVRPFVSRELIDRVVGAARAHGAAVCALPIAETVKRVRDGKVEATIDRTGLWAVQTPQAFDASLLREAHEKAQRDGYVGTDEAMLVERLGHAVAVVPGLRENIKITTPDDLRRARRHA
jgi:2-C-methyl-D-erythritol 4-phosphate cytidylyltransferase